MGNSSSTQKPNGDDAAAGEQQKEPASVRYDYTIVGGPASAQVQVRLKPGESILLDGGCMHFMLGPVTHESLKVGGLKKALMRGLSGESVILNKYSVPLTPANAGAKTEPKTETKTGGGNEQEQEQTKEQPQPAKASGPAGAPVGAPGVTTSDIEGKIGTIAFGTPYPGDAFALELKGSDTVADEWRIMHGAFLGCSGNVQVSGAINAKAALNPLSQKDVVTTTLTCPAGSSGVAFVSGYGGYVKHDVAAGETLRVDGGLFLACNAAVEHKTVKLGKSLMSSFLSGEGLGLEFTGPCLVYTQTRSLADLLAVIQKGLASMKHGGGSLPLHPRAKAQESRTPMQGGFSRGVKSQGAKGAKKGEEAVATMEKRGTDSASNILPRTRFVQLKDMPRAFGVLGLRVQTERGRASADAIVCSGGRELDEENLLLVSCEGRSKLQLVLNLRYGPRCAGKKACAARGGCKVVMTGSAKKAGVMMDVLPSPDEPAGMRAVGEATEILACVLAGSAAGHLEQHFPAQYDYAGFAVKAMAKLRALTAKIA